MKGPKILHRIIKLTLAVIALVIGIHHIFFYVVIRKQGIWICPAVIFNEENRSRSRHNVEGIFCRCTIFRLAKPAFFRYNENFTLVREFYVAYFVIPEISKNN